MFTNISLSEKVIPQDILHIDAHIKKIKAEVSLFKFRDKDTRQIVLYIPSLQLTGYGSTESKAQEMINFSLNDYFYYLKDLSPKQRETELFDLGWKKNKLKNKEFSQAYVDFSGQLKNFNAVADQIERLTVSA